MWHSPRFNQGWGQLDPMCGIAGIIYSDRARKVDEQTLVNMRDLLTPRGPDDSGTFVDTHIGLAHRRLSIIDLATGHQPMSTADGRITIVYNGEIYNFRELRESLVGEGAVFGTESDTEVILQLYAKRGEAAFSELNGIFAFAIWDAPRRRVLLARDRMGVKPLYYTSTREGLAFASEIKALFQSGLVSPKLNSSAVPEYFRFRNVAGEATMFENVRCLLPGQVMTISDSGVATRPLLSEHSQSNGEDPIGYPEAVDELDRLLQQAVERQMISDVPLGTFCSGGIDSSLITAIASLCTETPINTYSVGFHEADFDESEYAKLVSRRYKTHHHQLKLNAGEFAELMPALAWQYDEPLNFANSIQIFAVSRLAKERVTVALTGEGADELFGGYPRYYIPRLLELYRQLPRMLRRVTRWSAGATRDHRAAKIAPLLDGTMTEALLANTSHCDAAILSRIYRGEWPQRFEHRMELVARGSKEGLQPTANLIELDIGTQLVSILQRQDKMSMAASVEARVPFLDNDVVSFARSLPLSYKLTFRQRKRILKSVARRYLPDSVVDRRKSGFGVPLAEWTRTPGALRDWAADLPSQELLADFFDPQGVQELVQAHLEGHADNSEFLWAAINFVLWRKAYRV